MDKVVNSEASGPEGEPGNEDIADGNKSVNQVIFYPRCLICGKLTQEYGQKNINTFTDNNDDNPHTPPVIKMETECTINDGDLFRCLLKLFDVKFNKKTMLKGGLNSENCEGSKEQYPGFCPKCKEQLEMLYEVKRKLKELEKVLQLGAMRLKDLMTAAEAQFQVEEIYERNEGYYHIRRKVLGTHVTVRRGRRKSLTQQPKSEPEESLHSQSGEDDEEANVEIKIRRSTRARTKAPPPSDAKENDEKDLFSLDPMDLDPEHIKVEVDPNFSPDENFEDIDDQDCYDSDSDASFSPGASVPSDVGEYGSDDSGEPEEDEPPPKLSTVTKKKIKKSDTKKTKSSPKTPGERRKKPRKSSKESSGESVDGKKRRGSYIKARLKEDSVTGNCEYLDIKFQKLGEEQYKCNQCLEVVTNHSTMKKHAIRVHTDRFVCTICGQHKASGSDLNKHIREVHEGKTRKAPEKNMECPICGKPFGHKTALEFHKVTHYSEDDKREAAARGEKIPDYKDRVKLHQCGICGVVFNNITWLKKHEKIKHPKTEEEKFEVQKICGDCGKSFSEAYLKAHIERYHSNLDDSVLKPYVCSFCDKRFYSSARLIQHKRIHTGERPFKCESCDKYFISKNRLKYHNMQNHENRKPFPCTSCTAAFVTSYKLRRHIATVHEGKNQKDWNSKRDKVDNKVPQKETQLPNEPTVNVPEHHQHHLGFNMPHGSHSSYYDLSALRTAPRATLPYDQHQSLFPHNVSPVKLPPYDPLT